MLDVMPALIGLYLTYHVCLFEISYMYSHEHGKHNTSSSIVYKQHD